MTKLIDSAAVGVEVSWSFGDGASDAVTLPRADVIAAFARHGFGPEAPPASIEVDEALCNVRRLGTGVQNVAVRELAKPHKDTPRCVGVYVRRSIVQGAASEVGDGWELVARVRKSDALGSDPVCCLPAEGSDVFPLDPLGKRGAAEGHRLAALANSMLQEVHNGDISRSLVAAAYTSRAVSRRPGGGGVYMVFNGDRAESYVQLLRELTRMTEGRDTSKRFAMQAQEVYAKPLTAESWAASTEAQLAAESHRLLADLESLVARGVMREKTMQARGSEADEACALAEAARVFLGDKATELQAMFTKVSEAFKAASKEDLKLAHAALAAFPDDDRKVKYAKPATEVQPVAPVKRGRTPIDVNALLSF